MNSVTASFNTTVRQMTKMFQRKKKQPWTETSGERWFILLSARFYRRIANVSMSQFAFAAFASHADN